jgi:predicted transcriptional regulator
MWRLRQQEPEKVEISDATIRSTSKRRSAMKVLLFLNRENLPHTITEIAEGVDIDWSTAKHNLLKLMECNFTEIVEDKMDTRTRYYRVVDKEATKKAIELYKRWVSYKLAKLVPYQRTYFEKIKSDHQFIEGCKFYGLTQYEGFNAVTDCPKIETETTTDYKGRPQGLFLWRKEQ